ncbi:hypothetical protein T484DRAFT_2405913 [Baffinella frigidus]|nr:hypothetical protein T484DRAFT_2405913 [Cryptophyta sp. CCMP2293]
MFIVEKWRLAGMVFLVFTVVFLQVNFSPLLRQNVEHKNNVSTRMHASRTTEDKSFLHENDNHILPYELSLPARLADAVARSVELKRSNFRSETICPPGTGIGVRPSFHPPNLIGTVCEGWLNRETLQVLDYFLGRRMVGLEWSTGSGTRWLLQRLKFLFSVENDVNWLESTKAGIVKSNIDLSRWKYAAVPVEGKGGETAEYAQFPRRFFFSKQKGGFDFISVDGDSRDSCMREVIQHGLLKPYGILMLDNAERVNFHVIPPSHWIHVSFRNQADETALWMFCGPDDPWCQRAQSEIDASMEHVPQLIGSKYKRKFAERFRPASNFTEQPRSPTARRSQSSSLTTAYAELEKALSSGKPVCPPCARDSQIDAVSATLRGGDGTVEGRTGHPPPYAGDVHNITTF